MIFFYIYILQSEVAEETFYIGFTEDLQARLRTHNAGQVFHTVFQFCSLLRTLSSLVLSKAPGRRANVNGAR